MRTHRGQSKARQHLCWEGRAQAVAFRRLADRMGQASPERHTRRERLHTAYDDSVHTHTLVRHCLSRWASLASPESARRFPSVGLSTLLCYWRAGGLATTVLRHNSARHARSPAGGGSGSTFIGCRVSRIGRAAGDQDHALCPCMMVIIMGRLITGGQDDAVLQVADGHQ